MKQTGAREKVEKKEGKKGKKKERKKGRKVEHQGVESRKSRSKGEERVSVAG